MKKRAKKTGAQLVLFGWIAFIGIVGCLFWVIPAHLVSEKFGMTSLQYIVVSLGMGVPWILLAVGGSFWFFWKVVFSDWWERWAVGNQGQEA
jgi:hypothetical protein